MEGLVTMYMSVTNQECPNIWLNIVALFKHKAKQACGNKMPADVKNGIYARSYLPDCD